MSCAKVCQYRMDDLGNVRLTTCVASNTLGQAENSAYEQQRRAVKDPNAYQSNIYPTGTEYAVVQAESQLMSSVVGLLNENITEAIKSFYKLRKAYLALEVVMEHEKKFLKERSATSSTQSTRPVSVRSKTGSSSLLNSKPPTVPSTPAGASSLSLSQHGGTTRPMVKRQATTVSKQSVGDGDDDFDFVDAKEDTQGGATPGEYKGHLASGQDGYMALDNAQKKTDVQSNTASGLPSVPDTIHDFEKLTMDDTSKSEPDISTLSDHPIDNFVIAGSNFCFGMLLLLLSFIPPTFATLLKIIGFKGDRDRGMRMLWQATKFHDVHGAMAGVVLMGYLNGFTSLCDMIPSSGEGSYPKERCKALLMEMRELYPKSHLWLLEESRMLAADKELEKAVDFVAAAGESPLKQLEALSWFERSLNNMYMHNYKHTAEAFEKCITLNNWSHALYWYICGASYVELYRRAKTTNPEAAKTYAAEAEEFFKKVIPNTGKKKFMGRQLPFDIFVARKVQKWEARAKEWNCDFIDAIGVSPCEEMIFFWNGAKRMRNDHLEVSLENLAWSESAANSHWDKEGLDEKSILVLLRASTLRNMGRTTEAKALLQKEIIPVDRILFKGPLKDNWTAPCARYEMAASLWREADVDLKPEEHMDTLNKCRDLLVEVTNWDGFDLDARYVYGIASAFTLGILLTCDIELV
jgi:hypothetical protein